jgi:hypothetical protein
MDAIWGSQKLQKSREDPEVGFRNVTVGAPFLDADFSGVKANLGFLSFAGCCGIYDT